VQSWAAWSQPHAALAPTPAKTVTTVRSGNSGLSDYTIVLADDQATFLNLVGPGEAVTVEIVEENDAPVALTVTGSNGSFSVDSRLGDTVTVQPNGPVFVLRQDDTASAIFDGVYQHRAYGLWLADVAIAGSVESGVAAKAVSGDLTPTGEMPGGFTAVHVGDSVGDAETGFRLGRSSCCGCEVPRIGGSARRQGRPA